jgi:hypothetical protein
MTLAPVTQISAKGPFNLGPRSILKPDSLPELSVHERLIWLEATATTFRLLGAAGGVEAVGVKVGGRPAVKVGVGVRVRVAVAAAVGDDPGVEVRVGVAVRVAVEVRVRVCVAVGGASVVANVVFDQAESPAKLYARTR